MARQYVCAAGLKIRVGQQTMMTPKVSRRKIDASFLPQSDPNIVGRSFILMRSEKLSRSFGQRAI